MKGLTNEELQEQIEQLKVGFMSLDDALTQVEENFESLTGRIARTVDRLANRIEEVNDSVKALESGLNGRIDSVNQRVTDLNQDRI
jgi:exonuclease VII small subunit